MRRIVLIGLGLVLAGALLAAAAGWRAWTRGADPQATETVLVRIPPGMTLGVAADTLSARGLLRDRRILLLGARLTGRERSLRAGLYELSAAMAPRELLEDLSSGRSVQVRVTVPEGLDVEETAAILAGALGFAAADFVAAADSVLAARSGAGEPAAALPAAFDSSLAAESARQPRRFHRAEGYLAPDTYLFAEGTEPQLAAAHLVDAQLARLADAAASNAGPTTSPHELLTLASIVEAEARRADERGRIAAVYANRLVRGRRLEADPTVAFVLRKKGQRLFYRDLEVDSAWNTYRRRGLPPGPIGSPGLAALAAAARPDSACDALYFVSDGADGHVFSRTAAEHEEAVRRFRSLRAPARRSQTD